MQAHALILGGGIAGLSAAIALRQAGYSVEICEQAAELGERGAAFSLWANAIAALETLGAAAPIVEGAAPIREITGGSSRRPVIRVDLESAYHAALPAPRLPTRTLLQQSLRAVLGDVALRLGMRATAVEQDARGVITHFADGSRRRADLLIAADGIWSPVATQLIGTWAQHCGYGGVLALGDAAPGARQPGECSEFWARGARLGLLDLGGDRTYWFLMLDQTDPARSRALTMADVRRTLPRWPRATALAIEATPEDRLIPFSVHAKPPPVRLGQGRIICVGDAAHAMEPNLGQGGCQAIEDAAALGAAARVRAPEAILPLFEAMRLKRARQFVAMSAQARWLAQPRNRLTGLLVRPLAATIPESLTARRIETLHRLPDYGAIAGS